MPAGPGSLKPAKKIRWLRWSGRVTYGGVTTIRPTKCCHAFIVGSDGRMSRKSLCGRKWRERDLRIEKDPSVGRCQQCDAELRSGSLEAPEEVPDEPETPPDQYEPRFRRRDYE